jgi:hypothetical protein
MFFTFSLILSSGFTRNDLEDLGIDGRVMLKWIMRRFELDSSGSE